jgi:copper/silver efflux system protein
MCYLRIEADNARCSMIGGMISSTLLTLIVIPAIFGPVKQLSLSPAMEPATAAT